jgi:hypothetical protein
MILYIAVFLAQLGFGFIRVWNLRAIANKDRVNARISWFLFGCVHLVGISIGVKSVIEGDITGVVIWFAGGSIGQEISMRNWKK